MTFNEIIKANPAAGELAIRLVRDALMGKPDQTCSVKGNHLGKPNLLALLTSLDAWIPLWEKMSEKQKQIHNNAIHKALSSTIDKKGRGWTGDVFVKPHHHLEAALRTLEVECPECHGKGIIPLKPEGHNKGVKLRWNDCTCNAGKVSLMTIWNGGNDEG